jgi:ribosome maturation factor RimP
VSPAAAGGQDDHLARLEAAAAPVLAAHGLTLVDLEWRREGRRQVVRFFVDKTGGVGIDDCQRFSREVGDLLDVTGLLEDAYDLEVSSPGLDRELRKERELRWARGRVVRGFLREPVGERMEFEGTLAEVTGDTLTVVAEGGGRVEVPRALVTRVRLVPVLGGRGTRSGR